MSRPSFPSRLLIAGLAVAACGLAPSAVHAAVGDVELVSRGVGGQPAVEPFRWSRMETPRASADGRRIVFASNAVNLVAEDTRDQIQVYLRDVERGTTELISRGDGPDGAPADSGAATDGAFALDISADGRYVLFSAVLDGRYRRIYRRDVEAQRTVLVSRADDGTPLGGRGGLMTADGTKAVVDIGVPSGEPEAPVGRQTYLRDIEHGRSVLVSREDGPDGAPASHGNTSPVGISPNGRYVTFVSRSGVVLTDEQVPGTGPQLFLRDVRYGRTILVSRSDGPLGPPVREVTSMASPITADGCQVAFSALGTGVAPGGPANGGTQSYVRDLCSGRTTLVSRADGHSGVAAATSPHYEINGLNTHWMSADGRYVAFSTAEANIVPGSAPGRAQTFLRDRVAETTTLISRGPGVDGPRDEGNIGQAPAAVLTPDARFLVFASTSAFVAGTVDGTIQIYRRDLGPLPPGTPIAACGITDDPGIGSPPAPPAAPCETAPAPEPPKPEPATPTPVDVPVTGQPAAPPAASSPSNTPVPAPLLPVLSAPTLVRAPSISDVRVTRKRVSLWLDLPATVRVQVRQQRTVVRRVGKRRVRRQVWRLARTVDRSVKRGGRVRVALPTLRRARYRVDVRAYGTSTTVSPRVRRSLDLRTTKERR